MATLTALEGVTADADVEVVAVSLTSQIRHFLWLSSGMFSMSAFFLAFLEYWNAGPAQQAATHFLAAVASAALFGVATVLKLGPEES